ncbi:MAG: c-type cytochrome, partial [Caldilineaceae bacterium]|nr:c-type cytochrome [Caldilineaceae bacterium]
MENNRAEERSPILIAAGIGALIITLLIVLGLIARQNIPIEASSVINGESASTQPEDAAAAAPTEAANSAEPTVADSTSDGNQDAAAADAVAGSPLSHDELVVAFATGGCSGCHTIPGIQAAAGQIGPNLAGIGTAAATRIEGLSAEEYIRQSMQDPEAFIAPECPTGPCPTGVMLPNYASVLSQSQFDGIVTYLLTLTDEPQNAAAPTSEAPAAEAPAATDTPAAAAQASEAEATPTVEAPVAEAPAAEAPAANTEAPA